MRHERGMRAAVAAVALLISWPATANDYPSKPIELVIPFDQGGGTDRVGRMFAEHAGRHLGTDVFVTNRTGGSGAVGFSHGATSRPDGYVLTMAVTTLAAAPALVPGYPVSHESFSPVCLLAALPMTISVRADSPYQTIEDLLQAAREAPNKIKVGTAGEATNNYLAAVALAEASGVEVTPIPYGGAGPALVALLGGHVDAAMADASEVIPYVESDQVRVLLVLGDENAEELPDVPTSASKSWEVNVSSFRGIAAPKDTPENIMMTLIDACERTAADSAFIEQMSKFGMAVTLIKGEEFGDWMKRQAETYAAAAEAAGIAD